jgi:hypothetical protein
MKLKASPPKPSADNREEQIAAIISGATAASPIPAPSPPAAPQPTARPVVTAPWKAAKVRDDLMVQVNVRLPEPLALKLKHVSHMTDRQRQDLVAEALEPLLNTKLLEIGYTKEDL